MLNLLFLTSLCCLTISSRLLPALARVRLIPLLPTSLSCIAAFLVVSGCAPTHAYRKAVLAWNDDGKSAHARPAVCNDGYAFTDDLIATELNLMSDSGDSTKPSPESTVQSRRKLVNEIRKLVNRELAEDTKADCWRTSYEDHQGLPLASHRSSLHMDHERTANAGALLQAPGYDLFFAEFDDQGERTDVSYDHVDFERSEVALIESQLSTLHDKEIDPHAGGGLNIVLFTHGWHGNASATNEYSTWFKAILEQIAFLERNTRGAACFSARALNPTVPQPVVSPPKAGNPCVDGASTKERRTVGIEIAWRGDSFDVPYIDALNFWDRKGAAQTAARGAVSDLMERLQKFYLVHSCRSGPSPPASDHGRCDTVHLLTLGHSFGALIDYHSLSNNLTSGVLADDKNRAYGFGDMTILLNPAFEGEREMTLMETSRFHSPFPDAKLAAQSAEIQAANAWPSYAQMPTLVTLQSEGDWATHYAFPAVRFVTGTFENTGGNGEWSRSIQASGWVKGYYTHRLFLEDKPGKDRCADAGQPLDYYCPFDLEHESDVIHPLRLCKPAADDHDRVCDISGLTKFPPFAPLWTVRVDRSIMRDHDDISDPAIVRFIALLFRAAYEQEELIGGTDAENK